jgi:hypothetical protein
MADPAGTFSLTLLPAALAVARLEPAAALPAWAAAGDFLAVVRTGEELTIMADAGLVPREVRAERPFRALKVLGPLPFDAVGVLAALTGPLAEARIPILAVSTFDTDYLLVREAHLPRALEALARAGHRLVEWHAAAPATPSP